MTTYVLFRLYLCIMKCFAIGIYLTKFFAHYWLQNENGKMQTFLFFSNKVFFHLYPINKNKMKNLKEWFIGGERERESGVITINPLCLDSLLRIFIDLYLLAASLKIVTVKLETNRLTAYTKKL